MNTLKKKQKLKVIQIKNGVHELDANFMLKDKENKMQLNVNVVLWFALNVDYWLMKDYNVR